MQDPRFTGLHGKELYKAHRAWRRARIKAGAFADDIRFAGLGQEQAVEVHTFEMRRSALFFGVLGLVFCLVELKRMWYGGANLTAEGVPAFVERIGSPFVLVVGLVFLAMGAVQLLSVHNPAAARASYIRATDERLANARKRSGLYPITLISMFEVYIAGMVPVFVGGAGGQLGDVLGGAVLGVSVVALAQPVIAWVVFKVLGSEGR